MEDYFGSDDFQEHAATPSALPPQPHDAFDFASTPAQQYAAQGQEFDFAYGSGSAQAAQEGQGEENDFNEFEEDEATKRIREEEERIQNTLREKSDREWQEKTARKAEGKRLLEEYFARKEQEKAERAGENLRKEAINKDELAKLNVEAGWRKVISNINVRAGEHKGKKEITRMREAILHRREDDRR